MQLSKRALLKGSAKCLAAGLGLPHGLQALAQGRLRYPDKPITLVL